jgi:hypothetical protein
MLSLSICRRVDTSIDDSQSHQEGPVEKHAARHEMQIEEAKQEVL